MFLKDLLQRTVNQESITLYARTLKDSVCRYKTMKGHQVKRKAGWDTHGLPVEIEVEKQVKA